MVLVFPATAVNAPVTPLVTVACCHWIVPVASLNVKVVPVPVHTDVLVALSVPTEVGWLTVTATAALAAGAQPPLVATTLYQVVTLGVTVNDTGSLAPVISANPSVADVVEDCHWIVPTEPEAKVRVNGVPLQIDPAPLIALATATGLTVIIVCVVEVAQAPLDTITLYAVEAVKFPVNNVVVLFPTIVVNAPELPLVTVACCHWIVPVASLNVKVVPVAVQIDEFNALSVPTEVG